MAVSFVYKSKSMFVVPVYAAWFSLSVNLKTQRLLIESAE